MKHPLNKVHAFSHPGEPVWYIEILRCMQFRAFCESLRATCQPGDFSQMWSRQCLFCQLVPTVDVASCWCHDRTAWVTNLNLMRITVTKTYAFRFQWKQSCTWLKEINIFWYQIITGWNIPKCLVHQTRAHMHSLLLSWFSWVQVHQTLGRWHLDFLGSSCWRVSKQGTVRFIPKIGELQGKRLFNCILHDYMITFALYIYVYANDAIYCVYIWVLTVAWLSPIKLMTVYLYISSQQFCPPAPTTESTQFPRGQKCHRRHICIGKTIQVDTAQFLSRGQQKETSGRHGLGLGISRWSCLSENFDFV